jgi:carbon storage regulator CsrA
MLVLSCKLRETIVIYDHIVVTVVRLEKGQVRPGIEAPGRLRSSVTRSLLASTPWCNRSPEGFPDRRSRTVSPGSGKDAGRN